MNTDNNRQATNSCRVVSEYFLNNLVMDETPKSKDVINEKQSTSKKPQAKSDKPRKRSTKKAKGQKDIRTLIKSKKNELLAYTKDFDLICKQSGIDVDPEQLQLAIALSKSLQYTESNESETVPENPLTCYQRKSKIRTTLQEYGFETKKSPSKKVNKRVKKYRKQYKLLLVSDTEKQQLIADKYAHILINNVCIFKTVESPCRKDCNTSHLYNLTTNVTYNCIKNNEIFYVNDLVPKSLNKKHIFKDWSKIPGRPISPKLEREDIKFEETNCTQEELNNLLTGPIEIARDIVKRNYNSSKSSTFKVVEETPIKQQNLSDSKEDHTESFCETEDNLIRRSVAVINENISVNNMSSPLNRCYSPDLFDEEVTIIMDSPEKTISAPKEVSERTLTVKGPNDFMELTNCVGILNGNHTYSNQIACLSQGSNKTRSNSNDFMDLTECIPACSQTNSNNFRSITSYEKPNQNCSVSEKRSLDSIKNMNLSSGSDEKSLDETIIMVEEDYSNVNTDYKKNDTPKENIIIDLVGNPYESTNSLNKLVQINESIIDLEESNMNNSVDDKDEQTSKEVGDSCKTVYDPLNCNNDENSESSKINNIDTVDLTQPCNNEDCLTLVKVQSLGSIISYEINTGSENVRNNSITSRNSGHCEASKNESEKNDDEVEECNNGEAMDLTQSSNSEDYQEVVEAVNNESLENTTTLNNDNHYSFFLDNDNLDTNKDIEDCVDLCKDSCPGQKKYYENNSSINPEAFQITKTNTKKVLLTAYDSDNDNEFDDLMENVSKDTQKDGLTSSVLNISIQNGSSNQEELDETQNYDCSRNDIDDCAYNANGSINDNSNIRELYEENNKIYENTKKFDDEPLNVYENKNTNDMQLEDIVENDYNIQNRDIDLTQQSDSSENKVCSPKIIEIPYETGKEDDISVAYDEICDRPNIIEDYEDNSLCYGSKSIDHNRSGSKEDGALSSSQHSEVFELSDNEFNYSINQHIAENGSLESKQVKFDIGGISIIDEFLHRKSLPRKSKLNCSCSSNSEPNVISNEVETCLPVDTLKSNQYFGNENRKSKSCEEVEFVKISTPLKSRSDNNILVAKTPKHDDYVIKTDQVTPMPNYENMSSPERIEELDKFGIKPLKRKRAIQILTHIYNQTHPLMEIIPNNDCSSPSKIRRSNNVETFPRRVISSEINSLMEYQSSKTSNYIEPNLSQPCPKPRQELSKKRRISQECTNSSYKENMCEKTTLIPDIRNIECDPEDWIFQKREKAKVHSCRVPLHIAFHNYVSSQRALREAILRYEPINIDDIHKGLVAIGYRYNPKDLLKFMDRKCITVKTADNSRKNKDT